MAAAFFPAATRFVDLRAVDLAVDFLAADFRAVDFRAVDFRAADLRAGAVFRFLVAAAFFPAATRFVDLRAVDFLAVDFLAADFLAADFRAVDFRAVDFRAVDFRAVDFRAVDFRAAALRAGAVFRFLVAAAFFPAATRFVDLRAVDFLAVDFLVVGPRPGVRLRPVGPRSAGLVPAPPAGVGVGAAASMGPPTPDVVVLEGEPGRSQAGVSGREDGSGAPDASRLSSSASRLGSEPPVSLPLCSLSGHSIGSRSDDSMCLPSSCRVIYPLPERAWNEAWLAEVVRGRPRAVG